MSYQRPEYRIVKDDGKLWLVDHRGDRWQVPDGSWGWHTHLDSDAVEESFVAFLVDDSVPMEDRRYAAWRVLDYREYMVNERASYS